MVCHEHKALFDELKRTLEAHGEQLCQHFIGQPQRIVAELQSLAETQREVMDQIADLARAHTSTSCTIAEIQRDLVGFSNMSRSRSCSFVSPKREPDTPSNFNREKRPRGSLKHGSHSRTADLQRVRIDETAQLNSIFHDDIDMWQGFASPEDSVVSDATKPPRTSVSSESTAAEALPLTLPSSWPEVARREGLDRSGLSMRSVRHSLRRKTISQDGIAAALCREEEEEPSTSWMLTPDSWICTVSEVFGIFVLVVELCLVPLMMAFEMPAEGPLLVVIWCLVSFWTWDLLLNVNTGVWTDSGLEMRRKAVFCARLNGWFVFDFLMVVLDWVTLLFQQVSDQSNSGRLLRFTKATRLIRSVSLLRLVRFARILDKWLDGFAWGEMSTILRILGLALGALWLSHVMGCVWYAVGKSRGDTGVTWYNATFDLIDGVYFRDLDTFYLYCTSFHWAMTQMTLGSMELPASNSLERLLSVFVMLFGLLFSSVLVSSVSAMLIGLQMRAGQRAAQSHTLGLYLAQNKVGTMLTYQVRKTARAHMKKDDYLLEKDVSALEFLPTSLRNDLRFVIYKIHLHKHRLFTLIESLHLGTARELCCDCVEIVVTQPDEDVFMPGGNGERAYHVVKGELQYFQDPSFSPVLSCESEKVTVGTWVCEAALWVHWIHVGRLAATSQCNLLVVEATALIRTLQRHRLVQQVSLAYALEFHRCVCRAKPPDAEWPTDLHVPRTDFAEIVMTWDQDIRTAVGLHGLTWFPGKAALHDEVMSGVSSLIPLDRKMERVVLVVTFRIEREDGRILVQLGYWEDSEVTPCCVLPGSKYSPDDQAIDAAKEVLRTKLKPLRGNVDILRSEVEVDEHTSRRHDLHTKYIRTVYYAKLTRVSKTKRSSSQGSMLNRVPVKMPTLRSWMWSTKTYCNSYLPTWDLLVVDYDGKTSVYAWLSAEEFAEFGSRGNSKNDKFLLDLLKATMSRTATDLSESSSSSGSDPSCISLKSYEHTRDVEHVETLDGSSEDADGLNLDDRDIHNMPSTSSSSPGLPLSREHSQISLFSMG